MSAKTTVNLEGRIVAVGDDEITVKLDQTIKIKGINYRPEYIRDGIRIRVEIGPQDAYDFISNDQLPPLEEDTGQWHRHQEG